jgi:exopolysaccharide biosynthesis polyprenyl glycosylphosphotransferase
MSTSPETGFSGPDLSIFDHQAARDGLPPEFPGPRRAVRAVAAPPPEDDEPLHYLRRYQRAAVTGDAVAAGLTAAVMVGLRFGEVQRIGVYALAPLLAPPVWVATVAMQRAYERRFLGHGTEEVRRVVDAGLICFTLIAVASFTAGADVSRAIVLAAVPTAVVLSLTVRQVLRGWLARQYAAGRGLQRVLVVGRADAAHALIEKFAHGHGLRAVGVCVPQADQVDAVHDVPVVGTTERVLDAVHETSPHVVAVATHPDLSGQALRRLAWALDERMVDLVVAPGIVEVAGPRLSIRPIAELSLLHLERPATRGGWLLLKAVFDRSVAALLVVALSPVFLGIAVAVRTTSRGPALFRQTRVGVGGRPFTMLKFRSMVADAEHRLAELASHDEGNGMLFKMRSDPRVTRVGSVLRRTSLDELPQLFNVLRGEMSLVGPRPPLPSEVAAYSEDAVRRLRLKPGVTGLWQISGRSDLSWEESLRLDLRYVDNWSLILDLSILTRTLRAVVRGSGAY